MRDDEMSLLSDFWQDYDDVSAVDYFDVVDFGLEPREYSLPEEAGSGIIATLDFKVWSGSRLVCYFFDENKERRFKLSLFPVKGKEGYFPKDGNIDFSELALLGGLFLIGVDINSKGNPVFLNAERIDGNPEYEC